MEDFMNNKLKENCKNIRKGYKRFPIFLIISTFTMIFLSIVIGDNFENKNILKILNFLVILMSGTLLVETRYLKANIKKLLSCIIVSLIAGILTKGIFENTEYLSIFIRLEISFILICLLLSIYTLYKNSNKEFNEYITKVAVNVVEVSIVNVILAIGIASIGGIFTLLIMQTDLLIIRLEILLIGFYYIPNIALSFINFDNSESKFIYGVIKYVLSGLSYLAYIVIYLYLFKIIITWNIPQNEVFAIITSLFFFSIPISIMVSYVNENKINKLLPYLFSPFILLQIISLYLRISEYGITPQRYIGIIVIIVEIIYILLYIINKKYIPNMLIVFCVIILVSGVIPVVNMFDLSNSSQYNILKTYKDNKKLNKEEKKKIYGAYQYLKMSEDGKEYIKKALNKSDIKEIEKYNSYSYDMNNNHYIYTNVNIDNIDIEGYSTLKIVYENKYGINKKVNKVFEKIKVSGYYIDMSEIINEYIENEKNIDNYFEYNNEIIVDENTKLILTNISLSLNDDKVYEYEFNGYLLVK